MAGSAGGVTVNVTPHVDWSVLHGELTRALSDEFKHLVAAVLRRECPVCK